MRNRKAVITIGFLIIALFLSGGCVKQKELAAITTPTPWTAMASGAHVVDKGRMFYGIGKASRLRSATLMRATADNQAQSEMARVIAAYLGALSHAAGYDADQDQERETISAMKASILRQARISDHWYDEPGGALYSLCSLELSALRQVLLNLEHLDDYYRKKMLAQVDPVFETFTGRQNPRPLKSQSSIRTLVPKTMQQAAVLSRVAVSSARRALSAMIQRRFGEPAENKS